MKAPTAHGQIAHRTAKVKSYLGVLSKKGTWWTAFPIMQCNDWRFMTWLLCLLALSRQEPNPAPFLHTHNLGDMSSGARLWSSHKSNRLVTSGGSRASGPVNPCQVFVWTCQELSKALDPTPETGSALQTAPLKFRLKSRVDSAHVSIDTRTTNGLIYISSTEGWW